MKKAKITYA